LARCVPNGGTSDRVLGVQPNMLKVSTKIRFDTLVFILEGSLSGLWVEEVDRVCCMAVGNDQCARVEIDLSDVTFVSPEGKRLLERLCASGAGIVSSTLLTKSLVDEIQGRSRSV